VTARYHGDCCPACGSHQVIPYAVLAGGSEEYGYQCLACQVMWPVLTYPARDETGLMARERGPAA
jgi:hypothetical protein